MHSVKLILVFMLGLSAADAQEKNDIHSAKELGLSELMIGSFDSSEQALNDSNYYSISLHMYPIWEKDIMATWLYVEQAVSSMEDKPYRQRIYRLTGSDKEGYISEVFTLPVDSLFIGKWKAPDYFEAYSPADLTSREGCSVHMRRTHPDRFEGSTQGENCMSSIRGASYATSKVVIDKGVISSWDQGFDADGKQVWGAVNGPYIFKKSK